MKRFATCAAAMALAAFSADAGETPPADVGYDEYGAVEVSLSGAAGDPVKGAEIMVTKSKGNCLACHEVTALSDAPFHGEVGPLLDGAGSRWTEAELRGLVANAKMTFDGSVMPAFYKTSGFVRPGDAYTGKAPTTAELPPILTAQEIEDVVAFLATLKDE
jgi:sulfur-oxidizing protein SoxX